MLLILLRAVYALVCAGAIATFVSSAAAEVGINPPRVVRDHPFLWFVILLALTQSVTVLHYGRVIADGLADEVKADPLVQQIYLGGE